MTVCTVDSGNWPGHALPRILRGFHRCANIEACNVSVIQEKAARSASGQTQPARSSMSAQRQARSAAGHRSSSHSGQTVRSNMRQRSSSSGRRPISSGRRTCSMAACIRSGRGRRRLQRAGSGGHCRGHRQLLVARRMLGSYSLSGMHSSSRRSGRSQRCRPAVPASLSAKRLAPRPVASRLASRPAKRRRQQSRRKRASRCAHGQRAAGSAGRRWPELVDGVGTNNICRISRVLLIYLLCCFTSLPPDFRRGGSYVR